MRTSVNRFCTPVSVLCVAAALALSVSGAAQTDARISPSTPVHSATPESTVQSAANPFRHVVVLGDSLSAGFQNGALMDTQQQNGWASFVAQQAGFELTLPLVGAPGIPAVIQIGNPNVPLALTEASGVSTGRENPDAAINDLAVPGATLLQMLTTFPAANPSTNSHSYADLVLGFPAGSNQTELQRAIAQNPSTVLLWIGGNDVLPALANGDPSQMTSPQDFWVEYAYLMQQLTANTHAHLFIANVPDATIMPYMTSASRILDMFHQLTNVPTETFSQLMQIYPGDLVNANGLYAVQQNYLRMRAGQLPLPLPPNDVLTASEVQQVQNTIDLYNQIIANLVASSGGTLVDMHSYFNQAASAGITINDFHASIFYMRGLISLDGIHPTNTGYALLANQFIASINSTLGTNVAPVDVSAVAANDPLFGANLYNASSANVSSTIPLAAARATDRVILQAKQHP